jgi:hypothetical protein
MEGELVMLHLRSHTEIHLEKFGINTEIFSMYRQPPSKKETCSLKVRCVAVNKLQVIVQGLH